MEIPVLEDLALVATQTHSPIQVHSAPVIVGSVVVHGGVCDAGWHCSEQSQGPSLSEALVACFSLVSACLIRTTRNCRVRTPTTPAKIPNPGGLVAVERGLAGDKD